MVKCLYTYTYLAKHARTEMLKTGKTRPDMGGGKSFNEKDNKHKLPTVKVKRKTSFIEN